MAAILCQSLGKLCSGTCGVMSNICSEAGKACNTICGGTCKVIGQAFASPFFPYLAVTCALNLPAACYGFRSTSCDSSNARWLWMMGIGGVAHIVAAFYITHKIQQQDNDWVMTSTADAAPTTAAVTGLEPANSKSKQPVAKAAPVTLEEGQRYQTMGGGVEAGTRANSFQRVWAVLGYDVGVAVYIVVFLVWMFWLTSGISKVANSYGNNGGDGICDNLSNWMTATLVCGYLYISLVCCSFCCSFLCLR